jgi:hypothetical protein
MVLETSHANIPTNNDGDNNRRIVAAYIANTKSYTATNHRNTGQKSKLEEFFWQMFCVA